MGKRTSTCSQIAFLLCLIAATPAAAQFSKSNLERMFDEARQRNVDLSKPHLWGFYFTSPTRPPLDSAATLLVADGYRLVAVEQVESGTWQLHVERVETHTVDSLYAANIELETFAKAHEIEKIHSMDIDLPPTE